MASTTILDLAAFSPRAQMALVMSLFESLREGGSFLVQVEAESRVFLEQIRGLQIPNLDWEILEKSDGPWKLRISKGRSFHSTAHGA